MNIKDRLTLNEQKMQSSKQHIQKLEEEKQLVLQELLRLDGEHRLLLELQQEESKQEIK